MCLINRLKHSLLVKQKKTEVKLDNSLEITSKEHRSDVSNAHWGEETQNGVRINMSFTRTSAQFIAEQFVWWFSYLHSWLNYQCLISVPCSAPVYMP